MKFILLSLFLAFPVSASDATDPRPHIDRDPDYYDRGDDEERLDGVDTSGITLTDPRTGEVVWEPGMGSGDRPPMPALPKFKDLPGLPNAGAPDLGAALKILENAIADVDRRAAVKGALAAGKVLDSGQLAGVKKNEPTPIPGYVPQARKEAAKKDFSVLVRKMPEKEGASVAKELGKAIQNQDLPSVVNAMEGINTILGGLPTKGGSDAADVVIKGGEIIRDVLVQVMEHDTTSSMKKAVLKGLRSDSASSEYKSLSEIFSEDLAIGVAISGIKGPMNLKKDTPDLSLLPAAMFVSKAQVKGILAATPQDPKGIGIRGVQRLYEGNPKGAYEDLTTSLQGGNVRVETLTAHAGAAYETGRPEVAYRSAKLALDMDPDNPLAKSILKLSRDRVASSKKIPGVLDSEVVEGVPIGDGKPKVADKSKMFAPEAVASSDLADKAAEAIKVGDLDRAVDLARSAAKKNPNNARALNLAATALNKLGKYEEALLAAEEAVSLAPHHSAALLNRGYAHAHLGHYKLALADSEKILRRAPKNAMAWQLRAFAYAGLGDRVKVVQSLEHAAKLDPRVRPLAERARRLLEESKALPHADDMLGLFKGLTPSAGASPAFSIANKPSWLMGLIALVLGGWAAFFAATRRRKQTKVAAPSKARALPEPYSYVRDLGRGGIGIVFEAKDEALDRSVAIKRLRDEIRGDIRERKAFLKEAQLVAKLHHPGIVEVYEIRETADEIFVVFEYLDGGTLRERIREGTVGGEEAVSWIAQASEAIDYAHSQKVIHRDLKPANLMVDAAGQVKVMDFGIARVATDAMTRLSRTDDAFGTPAYMAPEQEEGRTCKQSDVFALGVTLYELITGSLPFEAPGGEALHLQKKNGVFIPLSKRVSGIPSGLEEEIARALDPIPENRHASAGAFAASLKARAEE